MLDELYDDVLSIMTETGFVPWLHRNNTGKKSPLKWSYSNTIEQNTKSPFNVTWVVQTYEEHQYTPYKLLMDDKDIYLYGREQTH